MELSQRTLTDLGSLESLAPEDLSKIYKYFIQVVTKNQSNISLGTSILLWQQSLCSSMCCIPCICNILFTVLMFFLSLEQMKVRSLRQLWVGFPLCF